MQSETFRTTANIAGALAAITAALHSALEGTAPVAGMMASGPPGSVWFVWPELIERESGERAGFYVWWGSIRGELELPDPEDETLATVLWEGSVLHFELRYYSGIAPTVVKAWQSTEAAAGLFDHLVAQLGQLLPVVATVDQAPPAREMLQLEEEQAPAAPWANEEWYKRLHPNDQLWYNRLRPLKEQWEAGDTSDATIALPLGLSVGAIRYWRYKLKKLPGMEWQKLT